MSRRLQLAGVALTTVLLFSVAADCPAAEAKDSVQSAKAEEAPSAKPEPVPVAPVAPAPSTPPAGILMTGPFGPGHDPLKPPPGEPKEQGPGIVSAAFVDEGRADIEQLRGSPDERAYLGVAVDVRIAAGSTTKLLGASSVVARAADGADVPLAAACVPTAFSPITLWHGAKIGLAMWNVAIGERTWFCGGRNARLAILIRDSGFRVTTQTDRTWSGPMLLFFQTKEDHLESITMAGTKIDVPRTEGSAGKQGKPN